MHIIIKHLVVHHNTYINDRMFPIPAYQISYQQAHSYTIKYEAGGVEALRDNRGKQKNHDEMSELEKLRAEVKILRAEKQCAEMEASLKKFEEIERRRG